MIRSILMLAMAAQAVVQLPKSAAPPKYECVDEGKNSYKVWIGKSQNRLQAFEGSKAREIRLSGANVARPAVYEGQTLRYNGWNPKGRDIYAMLDPSTEFSVQYVVLNGSTRVRVGLVLDGKERLGLKCTISGLGANVVALDKDIPLADRYAGLVEEVASLRMREGTLKPIAVLRLEAIFRRMASLAEFKKGPDRTKFLELASASLKDIDPRTTVQLSAKLRGPVAAFWKQILEDIRYRYHPDSTRFASWVRQGARPGADRDIASVIAGFNGFVASAAFRDKALREFFVNDVTPSLKELDENDLLNAKTYLTDAGRSFFEPLWLKVNGKKTLVDYPSLESATRQLAANLRSKEFDAYKVYKSFSNALRILGPMDAEAKDLFHQAMAPLFKMTSPRQREDMAGWLDNPTERAAFDDLVK